MTFVKRRLGVIGAGVLEIVSPTALSMARPLIEVCRQLTESESWVSHNLTSLM